MYGRGRKAAVEQIKGTLLYFNSVDFIHSLTHSSTGIFDCISILENRQDPFSQSHVLGYIESLYHICPVDGRLRDITDDAYGDVSYPSNDLVTTLIEFPLTSEDPDIRARYASLTHAIHHTFAYSITKSLQFFPILLRN